MKSALTQTHPDVCPLRYATQPSGFDDRSQRSTTGSKRHDRARTQQLNAFDNGGETFGALNAQDHIFRMDSRQVLSDPLQLDWLCDWPRPRCH
jgi:hypothetical protein